MFTRLIIAHKDEQQSKLSITAKSSLKRLNEMREQAKDQHATAILNIVWGCYM